jgi:hypothetical protein
MSNPPKLNDVVALLADVPTGNLARGQVGTVVESQKQGQVLVEFVDEEGRVYAITPVDLRNVLVLHYEREVA